MINHFDVLTIELDKLKLLPPGWDAEPPNDYAIELSKKIYRSGEQIGLFPFSVAASVENGIVLTYFADKNVYTFVECSNDNVIMAVISTAGNKLEPIIWEVDFGTGGELGLDESVLRIKNAIDGR